jgi:FdhE protein
LVTEEVGMIENREGLEALFERLGEATVRKPDYGTHLALWREIIEYSFRRRTDLVPGIPALSGEDARLRFDEGFPLMDMARFSAEPALVSVAMVDLAGMVTKSGTIDDDEARKMTAVAGGIADLPALIGVFLGGNGLPENLILLSGAEGRSMAGFLLHNALKPLFQAYAIAWGPHVAGRADWDKGYCPICGGGPAMEGFVGEEGGVRMLLCHRCDFTWQYPRVRCPFCDNRDHEKLRYMIIEGEPTCRIDVCEECKGYLKGVDLRETGGRLLLEADDLITPHLDVLARREGYVRKAPDTLGYSF